MLFASPAEVVLMLELRDSLSLKCFMSRLGEERARLVREICGEEKWAKLEASSAALAKEDEEELLTLGYDRLYHRLEKMLSS